MPKNTNSAGNGNERGMDSGEPAGNKANASSKSLGEKSPPWQVCRVFIGEAPPPTQDLHLGTVNR